jgi:DtxR family Mn-dependent transcriptional regulator
MYLKSLYELSATDDAVSIAGVAERLGVTPVSASEMIHRLERDRLVIHRRYHGVRLTSRGRSHAVGLIRRHRVWECFLHSELGLPWETVHRVACELEHAAPDEVTDALAARLGEPDRCPHGNPIPDRRRNVERRPTFPLTSLRPGDSGILISVHPETDANLSYLAAHGFRTGAAFRVDRIEPTDRLYLLRHEGGTIAVGPELAGRLNIERAAPRARAEEG